jgi:hypothetical protein
MNELSYPQTVSPAETAPDTVLCEHCNSPFTRRTGNGGKPQRFCSPQCRHAFHAQREQRSPTCSADTTVPAVIQPTEKDVRETAGSDFDWVKNEDDIVLRSQPETAIYFNPHGSLVIRQRNWPDDDPLSSSTPRASTVSSTS